MRHVVLVLAVLLVLALPAEAAHADEGHVIFDATVIVTPAEPMRVCMMLDAGTVAVTTRLVHTDATRTDGRARVGEHPVSVALYAYRGIEGMPGISTAATTAEAVAITPVPGGLYCLDVLNHANMPAGENPNFWGQWIALRITHD